ncbi:MAG TPA: AMP-binding protein, partial [Saprospiraceae bacterium]|nr:AMP-binding protein [Saprospiraceae bacterium]
KSVLSSHAPFHFDLSIFDLFVSIKHAAALVLIDAKHGKNPRLLSQLIEEKKITHWYSTPTILKLMLHYGKIDRYDHTSLMYVLFAGEVFPVKPLKQLTEIWPHAKFFNLYGPTETNVCTWFKIPLPLPKSQLEPFPIGEVCSHLEGKLVHRGTAGNELCISGPAVCIGYWKDDAQTGKSTFYDEGKRWYSTGDLVSVNSNGDYVYRERIDRMVKKNGFRVELGEIENVLHRMPEITDAAAISTVDEDLQGKIKVFVQKKAEEDLNSVQLKQFCLNYLPHYMVPDEFIYLKKIPKTSTNKTDYQKLKAYSS